MQWDSRAVDREPEVAEVSDRGRRPVPRWLRAVAVVVGVVLLGWLAIVRITSDEYTLNADPPRFTDDFTVEVDLAVQNRTDDDLAVFPTTPRVRGYRFAGLIGPEARLPSSQSVTIRLGPRGGALITLVFEVADCADVLLNPGDAVAVNLQIGRIGHRKDVVRVLLGDRRTMVPPVCKETPKRGFAIVADQDLRIVGDSVSVDIAVQNTGGRPIRYDEATLPAGAPAAMMRSVPPTKSDREIEVGTTTNVLVVFIKQACRAPEDAAATVRLRFHTPATGESQQVEVVLADTWLNLLGACGTRDLG